MRWSGIVIVAVVLACGAVGPSRRGGHAPGVDVEATLRLGKPGAVSAVVRPDYPVAPGRVLLVLINRTDRDYAGPGDPLACPEVQLADGRWQRLDCMAPKVAVSPRTLPPDGWQSYQVDLPPKAEPSATFRYHLAGTRPPLDTAPFKPLPDRPSRPSSPRYEAMTDAELEAALAAPDPPGPRWQARSFDGRLASALGARLGEGGVPVYERLMAARPERITRTFQDRAPLAFEAFRRRVLEEQPVHPALLLVLGQRGLVTRMTSKVGPTGSRSAGASLADLPPGIAPTPGALSLVADFDHAKDGAVDVYLVNGTAEAVAIETQDGDPFTGLDAQIDGQWTRAWPWFPSFCGNSYYSVTLSAGAFRQFQGHVPNWGWGRQAPVRFTMRGAKLVSNAGPGWVTPGGLEAARMDGIGIQKMQTAVLADIARMGSTSGNPGGRREEASERALRELGRRADGVPIVCEIIASEGLENSSSRGSAAFQVLWGDDRTPELAQAVDACVDSLVTRAPPLPDQTYRQILAGLSPTRASRVLRRRDIGPPVVAAYLALVEQRRHSTESERRTVFELSRRADLPSDLRARLDAFLARAPRPVDDDTDRRRNTPAPPMSGAEPEPLP